MESETVYNVWSSLDHETQVALLRHDAKRQNVFLEDDAARYVAQNFQSNADALRDAFARLMVYSSIYGRRLTLNVTKRILGRSIAVQGPKGTIGPLENFLFALDGAQQATGPRRHSATVEASAIFRLKKSHKTRKITDVRLHFEVNMREFEREALARRDVYERALEILAKKRKRG